MTAHDVKVPLAKAFPARHEAAVSLGAADPDVAPTSRLPLQPMSISQPRTPTPLGPFKPALAGFVVQASRLRAEADAPRDYLIEGIAEPGDVALLLGIEGIGKTNLLADLCAAVLSGEAWCGFGVRRAERVLYVCAEGSPVEIARRVRAFARGRGLDPDIIDQRLYIARPFELEKSDELERLVAVGRTEGFGLVVLDPISRMLAGDENSAPDVTRAMRSAERLAQAMGGVLVAVHHVSRTNETAKRRAARGSTAFESNARVVLRCKRERRSNGLTVWVSKINNGAEPAERSCVLTFNGDAAAFEAHHARPSAGPGGPIPTSSDLAERIIEACRVTPGVSLSALTKDVHARKQDVAAAVLLLEASGVLRVERGKNKSSHFATEDGA